MHIQQLSILNQTSVHFSIWGQKREVIRSQQIYRTWESSKNWSFNSNSPYPFNQVQSCNRLSILPTNKIVRHLRLPHVLLNLLSSSCPILNLLNRCHKLPQLCPIVCCNELINKIIPHLFRRFPPQDFLRSHKSQISQILTNFWHLLKWLFPNKFLQRLWHHPQIVYNGQLWRNWFKLVCFRKLYRSFLKLYKQRKGNWSTILKNNGFSIRLWLPHKWVSKFSIWFQQRQKWNFLNTSLKLWAISNFLTPS